MSSQPSTTTPSLGQTLGALYIGATLAAILFGITNLQVLIYYKKYSNDWWLYRYSVALLWVLDALHVALGTHALYFYLIDMFGNATGALEKNEWSMNLQLSLNDVIIVYVQGLYAIRLWKLGRHFHKFLPWFVFLAVAASLGNIIALILSISLILSRLGSATFMIYEIYIIGNLISVSTITVRSIYALFSTIAVADFIIAFMMCYYLHKSRGDKLFSSSPSNATSSSIRVSYEVKTSVLVWPTLLLIEATVHVLCSLLSRSAVSQPTQMAESHETLQYIVWPKSLIFLGIDFILPKLYVNSLLAMFNYRRKHSSKTPTQESVGPWVPAVLQIKRRSSGGRNMEESNISIPLSEIQDTHSPEDKPGNSGGTLDCPV
ncbi:uncharacterized protein ARMOST_18858 [Armillaria ostoyae]|uniref:DUF6534 domain-containing protein n=1 Tax=Armillaria ostoyae TaxID=47428 RepID=A0A284S2Z3_ARMOS|nr:uncharacterized protein ARMOST_18858 [Armillaria ostoyae]